MTLANNTMTWRDVPCKTADKMQIKLEWAATTNSSLRKFSHQQYKYIATYILSSLSRHQLGDNTIKPWIHYKSFDKIATCMILQRC